MSRRISVLIDQDTNLQRIDFEPHLQLLDLLNVSGRLKDTMNNVIRHFC